MRNCSMSAKIITIAIEKGGTGKTVTASNLAYLMGDEGKKVLCVDTDPQGNLTKALSGGLSITSDEFYGKALYNLFDGFLYHSKTRDFIAETQYENVDMIPCDAQTRESIRRIELLIGDAERLKDGDPRKVSGMGIFCTISSIRYVMSTITFLLTHSLRGTACCFPMQSMQRIIS